MKIKYTVYALGLGEVFPTLNVPQGENQSFEEALEVKAKTENHQQRHGSFQIKYIIIAEVA